MRSTRHSRTRARRAAALSVGDVAVGLAPFHLERRVLLSTIQWTNRLFGDNFSAFGADETTARAIADRAIGDWERVITDFNYDGGDHPFEVEILADPGSNETTIAGIDPDGKPTAAFITLNPDGVGGNPWYFDSTIGTSAVPDDSEFVNFVTPFVAARNGNGDFRNDFRFFLRAADREKGRSCKEQAP